MAGTRIGLREVRGLEPGEIVWDAAVPGFGARRQKDAVAYVLKYRTAEGRQRWHTIGRHGAPWTPDMARAKAKELLGEIVKGVDPAGEKIARRKAANIAELCELYLADAEAGRVLTRNKVSKKMSTLVIDKGRIERHIKPVLGSLPVATVTRADIERFLHSVAEGKTAGRTKTTKKRGLARVKGGRTAATRSVGLLGAIFTYAIRRGLRADNPVRGVARFADRKRDRTLSEEEWKALGNALRQARTAQIWPPAITAARFLAVTGWRRGEALSLRWNEVDLAQRMAVLGDTKTGRSMRPLSIAACNVLQEMTKLQAVAIDKPVQENSANGKTDWLVFPATRGDGPMSGFPKLWARIAKLGSLPPDITPHVLRHSFASLAADLGYSEPTIAALLGHKGRTTTSRYVHSADAVLLAAADATADKIAELMQDCNRNAA